MKKVKTIWKVLLVFTLLIIGLFYISQLRNNFLKHVLQNPNIYFASILKEQDSLVSKRFGDLSIDLLVQDSFVESTIESNINNSPKEINRNWVILDKEKSIYGQYTEFFLTKEHQSSSPEQIISGVIQIWKSSFSLQEIKHQISQKDNSTWYNGIFKDGSDEISVLAVFAKKYNVGKLLILRTPYYEKNLFERMKQSIHFK